MTNTRIEQDGLGAVEVPEDAWFGAQTQRAVENFPVNGQPTTGDYPELIQAFLSIKRAAAQLNHEIGLITEAQTQAIEHACDQIISTSMYDQFPVHYLHGGGGTSVNMNVNEVISNIGEVWLGGQRGEHQHLHPNDQVNLNQSTNDTYPTACHLAVLLGWQALRPVFAALQTNLTEKATALKEQRRLARTCLQDAVDITFGDFFSGYQALITRCEKRIDDSVQALSAISLGGTIVGRPQDVPAAYFDGIVHRLNAQFPHYRLRRSDNLFDAAQNLDDLVAVSAQLELTARSLIKIAKDVRLLASGPQAGFQELILPAVQPGSSIMPGKVNPVIPEFLIQVCYRVIGNHQMAAMAVEHGELDLNVWESPVIFGILDSMNLLGDALTSFQEKCLTGLQVSVATNSEKADSLIALLVSLSKVHGYSAISQLCKSADGDFDQIRALIEERGLKA